MTIDHEHLEMLLAGIFVIVHAHERFNDPPNSRSTTTAARYHTAAAAYYSLALFLFGVLACSPHMIEQLVPDLHQQLESIATPFLAALLVTVLLPRVPILAEIDQWIRSRLHRIGAIPFEARRLAAELRRCPFAVQGRIISKVSQEFERNGFPQEWLGEEHQTRELSLWIKISALVIQLEEWEEHKQGFMHTFDLDYKTLRTRYDELVRRAQACFALAERSKESSDPMLESAVRECQLAFGEREARLHRMICDFISRGVLQTFLTRRARYVELRDMGFDPEESPRFSFDHMLTITLGILSVLTVSFLAFSSTAELSEKWILIPLITLSYGVAVASAVIIADTRRGTQREDDGHRPVRAYLAAGLVAVLFSILISIGLRWLQYHEWKAVAGMLNTKWPWFLASFALAFTTSINLDNPGGRHRAWSEALLQAAVMGGMTVLITFYLLPLTDDPENLLSPMKRLLALLRNAIIGGFVGYFVPTWFRNAPRPPRLEMEQDNWQPNVGLASKKGHALSA